MGERITVTSPICTLGRADGNGVQVNIAHVDTGSDVSALVPAALAADIERQGFLRAG